MADQLPVDELPVDLYIASYLDSLSAGCDWDDLKRRVRQGMIELGGLAYVARGSDGRIRVLESAAVGRALVGMAFPTYRFADSGEHLDEVLPPNSSGIVAISEERWSVGVERALMNAVRIEKSKLGRRTAQQLKRRGSTKAT